MGSSESKLAMSAAAKAEPATKKTRVAHLIDPRSPSAGIDRTPMQIHDISSQTSDEVKSECPMLLSDPRSPTIGIARTPVREVMRATVGSLAHRLGMLFHNEAEGKAFRGPKKPSIDAVEEDVYEAEEQASTEPLLTPQLYRNFDSLAEHANLLATPRLPPLQNTGDSSPFVLLEDPQVEVEIQTEADLTLEEAEEARESPLHKRLSMSLITCHEGTTASNIFAEVHCESTSPEPSVEVEPLKDGVRDHPYALPTITVQPTEVTPEQPEEAEKLPPAEETKELIKKSPSKAPVVPGPEQPQVCQGIRCPSFDSKSPSQAVFKPQWLGKGFGATGVRAKGVQGRSGKGSSSPLAVRVAIKNATNENKGQPGKLKQKGTEGRSPLQILKETNSPREQRSQMKLKVSTPDRQRLGQMDRRVLAVSLDKENR